jgi:hypothetical protein
MAKAYKNYKLSSLEIAGQERSELAGWRRKYQASKIKFDDTAKGIYLNVLKKTGRKGAAARAAGASLECVRQHREDDPDFAQAELEAKEVWADVIHQQAIKVSFGIKKPIFGGPDKDTHVGDEVVIATNILAMEMKRVEPDYKDKAEIDLTTKGSVLVAPADMSPADWIASQQALPDKPEPGTEETK